MRKNLLILFLVTYSTGATLGNEALCQSIAGCSHAKATLDNYHAYMAEKRIGFVRFVRFAQSRQTEYP